MGVDYYTRALIGCEIGMDKVTQSTRKRGCQHSIPMHAEHCPACGKAAWSTEIHTNEEVDGIEYAPKHSLYFKGREGQIIYLRYSTDHKRVFVGLYCCEADSYSHDATMCPLPDADLWQRTRKALEPLGLWDEDSFGLWAIQECSY